MTLPVIITSTREALAAVPMSFREACWNMGATRWQTIRTIVLPNAISGILTGVILQVSRAAGETAPILFTGAVFYKAVEQGDFFPYRLSESCMALSMHLFTLATQVTGVPEALQYGTAVVLLGAVLLRQLDWRSACASTCAPGRSGRATCHERRIGHSRVRDLRVRYGAAEVLHGISLRRSARSEILGIIGPAQSGKTTLLQAASTGRSSSRRARGWRAWSMVDGEDVRRDAQRLRAAPQDRHGVAPAGRPAAVDLRQRGLRAAGGGPHRTGRRSTSSSSAACGRPRCGTR